MIKEGGQQWRQYIIAGIANIVISSTGYSMGWTSPINVKLHTRSQSPLPDPITSQQDSWIGSLLNIGAIFGPFIGGFAASKIGRKWGLLSSSIPLLVGWILITTASNVRFLYAGRIFWGLGAGMTFTLSPMYCAEIATINARGALGSFIQVFITVGILVVYIIGPYISYSAVAYVGIGSVLAFIVTFSFMPESPTYYLINGDKESAATSLSRIRGKSREDINDELNEMAQNVDMAMQKSATFMDIFQGGNFRALYISCSLVFFQQFCGINAVLFYMTDIFRASGSTINSSVATIIIGFIHFGSSVITPTVVDRLGRRILLMISSCGTAGSLGLLGMYFLLSSHGSPIITSIGFLPVLCLVVFVFSYCLGLGPIPWAIIGELFPVEVKAIASPIVTAFCWILSFLVTKYFGPIAQAVGMYIAFWIFGVCCVVSFFFVFFFLPETKGKSFQEIQDMLAGKTTMMERL